MVCGNIGICRGERKEGKNSKVLPKCRSFPSKNWKLFEFEVFKESNIYLPAYIISQSFFAKVDIKGKAKGVESYDTPKLDGMFSGEILFFTPRTCHDMLGYCHSFSFLHKVSFCQVNSTPSALFSLCIHITSPSMSS